MIDKISDKDLSDWNNFIKKKEKLPSKDNEDFKNIRQKVKLIDLHGYTLNDANKTIEDFIYKCHHQNIKKIIVITGKGIHSENKKNPYLSSDLSILKYSVPEFIENNSNLMKIINEIKDAKLEDGGSGAFYIYLKKK